MLKLRLLDKLLLSFFLVTCLASGATTVYSIQFFSEKISSQALITMRNHIQVARLVYATQQEQLVAIALMLSKDDAIRNFTLFGMQQKLQALLQDSLIAHTLDHVAIMRYQNGQVTVQSQVMSDYWRKVDETQALENHRFIRYVAQSGKNIAGTEVVYGFPDQHLALTVAMPIFTKAVRPQTAGMVLLRYRISSNPLLLARIETLTGTQAAIFLNARPVSYSSMQQAAPCIRREDYQRLINGQSPLEVSDIRPGGRLAQYITLANAQDMPVAVLGLTAEIEPYLETRSQAIDHLLLIMGLCTIGAFFVAYLLAKSILIPVGKLMEGVERVIAGDFSHPIYLKNHDELGVLAQAFNSMSRQLHEFFEVLRNTIDTLTRAGTALSSERNLNNLLELVVAEARQVSNADGGTLYTVEGQQLRFKIMQSKSQNLFVRDTSSKFNETIPLRRFESDINAFVAMRKQVVCIPNDAEEVQQYPRQILSSLKENQAMLVVPLLDRNHNTLGVLQLITPLVHSASQQVPFSVNQREIVASLASQAAVAIENARNYETIAHKNKAFQRFVPTEFLHRLGRQEIEEVQLGDASLEHMSVLFSDIRAFTALSEGMDPQMIFEFLNNYLKLIGPAITRNGGFIDKFIGDAIMALFPGNRLGCADDALIAALNMVQHLQTFNQNLAPQHPPLVIGIGIHSGPLTLGTIGFESRMESTVIGDTVNLASRVESLTKLYGITIGVTEKTLSMVQVPGYFQTRVIDTVQVKGKQQAHTIHELINADPEPLREIKLRNLARYHEALAYYKEGDFVNAEKLLSTLQRTQAQDRVLEIYLTRCRTYQRHPPAANWDGITRLDAK